MNRPERPNWDGRTVVCLASGPSLTAEDCEKVRTAGHPAIVTNTTFRIAPWADALFGMDMKWWQTHHKEIAAVFTGRKLSTSHAAKAYGAESLYMCPWFPRTLNSGEGAIVLAMAGKPKRIVLLGYDCQATGGKKHWHADHPKGLGNAGSIGKWPKHFANVARNAKNQGIEVLNATRQTALTCFPRMVLEDVI